MEIEDAVQAFGRGFTFTRSFTHPYLFERCGRLWVMRDAPRRKSDYRREEWIVVGVDPAEAEAVIQANRRANYAVCAALPLDASGEAVKRQFKRLGYRHLGVETFFVHDLDDIQRVDSPVPILRVATPEQAELLKRASGTTQIRLADLETDPPLLRQYIAMEGGEPVGWVRSVVCGESGWCSNMFVKPPYRRRGIGAALMSRMLQDDKTAGLRSAVLLASRAGALLYPRVGYSMLGHLWIFHKRSSPSG